MSAIQMFASRYRCPECRSDKTQFLYSDSLHAMYNCRDCGMGFQKLRGWARFILFLLFLFSIVLLFTIISHIPLGVL
jgi:rubredoxin